MFKEDLKKKHVSLQWLILCNQEDRVAIGKQSEAIGHNERGFPISLRFFKSSPCPKWPRISRSFLTADPYRFSQASFLLSSDCIQSTSRFTLFSTIGQGIFRFFPDWFLTIPRLLLSLPKIIQTIQTTKQQIPIIVNWPWIWRDCREHWCTIVRNNYNRSRVSVSATIVKPSFLWSNTSIRTFCSGK